MELLIIILAIVGALAAAYCLYGLLFEVLSGIGFVGFNLLLVSWAKVRKRPLRFLHALWDVFFEGVSHAGYTSEYREGGWIWRPPFYYRRARRLDG